METATIDFNDIQGLLARGYGNLPESCYLMLQFADRSKARAWFAGIADQVSIAAVKEAEVALQIAFTYQGIVKLLDEEKITHPFSREFTDGMTTPERQRILGDLDLNGSSKWEWGSELQEEVHAVLMLYGKDEARLQSEYEMLASAFPSAGIKEIIKLVTNSHCPGHKEHFGFADGMSQPRIKGFEKNQSIESLDEQDEDEHNTVMPGEFILGYENEYGKQPFSPMYRDGDVETDLGRNGSYMVFRQLEQDVKGFWEFVYDTAKTSIHFADKDPIYIASKMVGRFPNGNPLSLVSDPLAPPLEGKEVNRFNFKERDPDGLICPIGSHIRKSNPRDGIDESTSASIKISKRHRILRRGRDYGEPLDISMEPDKMLASTNTDKRGLFFICFNTNIARQFEFIQQAWDNNPKFGGLEYDIDPIIGYSYMEGVYGPATFTIPDCPVRRKVNNIPQFVFVKGGAYFFMPGIAALRFMAGAR